MMTIHKLLMIAVLGFAATACNSEVKDFVRGVASPSAPTPQLPPNNSPNGYKISPGHVTSTGATDMALDAHVTATNHTATSADISGTFSISRTRASVQ
jgi:hypothetical protein